MTRVFLLLLLLQVAACAPTSFINMVLDSKAELSAPQPLGASPPQPSGKLWVLLVAGSSGYMNYRHQADVCHAYQVMHSNGIPDSQIVVMMYDDIAKSFFNTKRGAVYNEPGGPDVYAGVPIDYRGRHVNPKNFLAVLRGDAHAVKGQGSGRVIESSENDRVFVYFADHGAPGLIAFPSRFIIVPRRLYAHQLLATLTDMHTAKKYDRMVMYMEACESGSMFNGLLPSDLRILAVTAASPYESSFACYYDNVLGTFLGDCFSNHWLEHEDQTPGSVEASESLAYQVSEVKSKTNSSHVCVYGEVSLLSHRAAEFMGSRKQSEGASASNPPGSMGAEAEGPGAKGPVSSRDVNVEILRRRLHWAETEGLGDGHYNASHLEELRAELKKELAANAKADSIFKEVASVLAKDKKDLHHKIWEVQGSADQCHGKKVEDFECLEESTSSFEEICQDFTDYSLRYIGVIQRACDLGISSSKLRDAFKAACPGEAPETSLEMQQEVGGCSRLTTEDTCMANAKCTWCKCSAVPSKCYTRKQAKRLPPAIFTCDA